MALVTLYKSAGRGRRLLGIDSLAETAKENPRYEKNKDCFDVLKPLQAVAIQRAKARTEQVRSQGIEPISRQSNPLTTVWELVKYLNSKI